MGKINVYLRHFPELKCFPQMPSSDCKMNKIVLSIITILYICF